MRIEAKYLTSEGNDREGSEDDIVKQDERVLVQVRRVKAATINISVRFQIFQLTTHLL